MTRSSVSLGTARWLLPWIALVFVSITLAYAMGSFTHGGSLASDQPEVHAAASTDRATHATDVEQSTTAFSEKAKAPSGGGLGVMFIASPASTGHASPDGCCTWD